MIDERLVDTQLEAISKMSVDEKVILLKMGAELLMSAYTVEAGGWHSLAGFLWYVDQNSPLLSHTLFHALNGSRTHQDSMSGFFRDSAIMNLIKRLNPLEAIDVTTPGEVTDGSGSSLLA